MFNLIQLLIKQNYTLKKKKKFIMSEYNFHLSSDDFL